MNYVDIDNVSFLQIQMCLNVADLGSFTKAAMAMHISQPALSKQISNLEQSLGVLLFIRGKSTDVRLTPAARVLFAKWREMVKAFNVALLKAAEIQSCKMRGLVLSSTPSAKLDTVVTPVLDLFEQMFPAVEIRVDLTSVENQKEDLLKGTTDVILSNPFRSELFLSDEIRSKLILPCPWSVGMREINPLAQRETLSWSDLRAQQFVVPNSQEFIRKLNKFCGQAGFTPRISHITRFFTGVAVNVRGPNEVFLTDRYLDDYGKKGYVYFDMEGAQSGLMLATRKLEHNPRVADFLQCIEQHIRNCNPTP